MNKIFIFPEIKTTTTDFATTVDYGKYFIAITDIIDIGFVYIMKRLADNNNGELFQYKKIGNCKFWNGSFDILTESIVQEGNTQFIPFENNHMDIEIAYLSLQDIADLSASDTKYGKGNHSSKSFCICCDIKYQYAPCSC